MGNLARIKLDNPTPNLDISKSFLDILDPDDIDFSFIAYSDIRDDERPTRRGRGTLNEWGDAMLEWNADQYSICVAINQIKPGKTRQEKDVQRVRAVIVDDDAQRNKPRTKWPMKPSIVVESSRGKYHYYWLCSGLTSTQFRLVQETLTKNHGHDPQLKAANLVLRMPGFLHQKGDPFRTQLIAAPGYQYSASEILKAYPPHKDETSSAFYAKKLRKIDRSFIEEGNYKAVAYEWTLYRKGLVVIRYSVETPDGSVFLDQYISFRTTRGGWIKVGYDSYLHSDLVTLTNDRNTPTNKLQINLFEQYFGRKLEVYVGTVKRRRDKNNPGCFKPRPLNNQYSRVEFLMSAK